jgi:NAD(P)H dehydrogenase (quinone)
MAVGSIPNASCLGLEEAGIRLVEEGFAFVDRVSRTSVRGVYASGDCTGVLMLASVAAMQGRIAMWHALGDAVKPLNLNSVSANVFTAPKIATVGGRRTRLTAVTSTRARRLGACTPVPQHGRTRLERLDEEEGQPQHRIDG